jgi:AcrR family transcriptional regulator
MASLLQNNPPTPDTRDKILNVAEKLLITKGFSATSLRAIAAEAGVNLAATHYHFGSKEGLFTSIIDRHTKPIAQKRSQALKTVLAADSPVTVEKIMRAFLSPLFDASVSKNLPALMGRLFTEPEFLAGTLLEEDFVQSFEQFIDALQLALPKVKRADLQWRLNFSMGAMIQLLNFGDPNTAPKEGLKQLIAFVSAGITQ